MELGELVVGSTITGRLKEISFARLRAFSGGPFAEEGWPRVNIHTNTAAAQAVKLEQAGAAGVQYQGHVVELMVDTFGTDWLCSGTMKDLLFTRPVPEGIKIRANATVVSVEDGEGGDLLTLDVTCLDEAGEPVLVGKTTAVRARAREEKVMQNV